MAKPMWELDEKEDIWSIPKIAVVIIVVILLGLTGLFLTGRL